MRSSFTRAALVATLCLVLGPTAVTAMTLDEAMRDTAHGLARQLKRRGAEVVHVIVDGPPGDGAAKRMQKSFIAALRDANSRLEVSSALPDFKLVLKYRRSTASNDYSMEVEWRDGDNNVLGQFSNNFRFSDAVEQAAIEGSTIDNSLDRFGRFQIATKENIAANLDAPPNVFVAPNSAAGGVASIISARKGSRFRIEILARPESLASGPRGYAPRAARIRKGYALCPLEVGEVYAVRVYNGAAHGVAVDLSIDGINMWATSQVPAWRTLGKFYVPARSHVTMYGWHLGSTRNPHAYGEFKIVDFPDSLVAEFGTDHSALGQVSAQFFAAWRPGEQQPHVDPVGVMGNATGIGRITEQVTKSQPVFIGRSLLAAVTVRYTRPIPADSPVGRLAPGRR